MQYWHSVIAGICWLAMVPAMAQSGDGQALAGINNYREYSPLFASSGQPTAHQLASVQAAGFERVIYIAFSDNDGALPQEDVLVRELGMEYLHIPVEWDNPRPRDFHLFAEAMQQAPEMKTLLHCQVNARATAFSFLYRVIHADVPMAEAKADMNSVWQPNETWRSFIFTVLEAHGISLQCPDCDWSVS